MGQAEWEGYEYTSVPVGESRFRRWLEDRGRCPNCGSEENLNYCHWRGTCSITCEECGAEAVQMGVMYFLEDRGDEN